MSATEAPVGADSTLEGELRSRLSDLQPTESLELSGSAGFALEMAADFRGRLKVERNREGFTVEVEGQVEGGVGAAGASARVGIAAGTKFRVATAAEAADLCDALIKGAVVNASNAVLPGASFAAEAAHLVGVEGDVIDANPRVRGYLGRVSEVKVDLTGSANAATTGIKTAGFNLAAFDAMNKPLQPLSARVQVQMREGLSVDLDKGELRQNFALTGAGEAFFKIPLVINSAANAKATVTVSLVRQMPAEMKEQLRDGRMSAAEAWARLAGKTPDSIVVKGVLEAGGRGASPAALDTRARITGEFTLSLAELQQHGLDPEWLGATLGRTRLKAEAEVAFGAGLGVDLNAVKAEVWLTRRTNHTLAEGTLADVADAARNFLDVSDPRALEAKRAVSTLNH